MHMRAYPYYLHHFHTLPFSLSSPVQATLQTRTEMTKCTVKPIDSLRKVAIIVFGRNSNLFLSIFGICSICCLSVLLFHLTDYHIVKALILPYNSCPKKRIPFFVLTWHLGLWNFCPLKPS